MFSGTINIDYEYGQTFKLLPISDIHYDGKGRNSLCDMAKLRKNLKETVDENTIILGIGDWFGGIIPSDVKRYRKEHDAGAGGDILDEQVNGLAEELMPYREQIYGIGDGNHEDSILQHCSTDLIKRLIEKLNLGITKPIIHLGFSGLLQLRFGVAQDGKRERVRSLIIRYHHGYAGGSRTEGGDITKFAHDVKFWQAHLFLYGHVHKLKVNDIEEGCMVGDSSWKTFTNRMLICGTYQRSFSTGQTTTYAEKKGYNPTTLRHPVVYLTPDRVSGVNMRVET
jgi:hypothetical protein